MGDFNIEESAAAAAAAEENLVGALATLRLVFRGEFGYSQVRRRWKSERRIKGLLNVLSAC